RCLMIGFALAACVGLSGRGLGQPEPVEPPAEHDERPSDPYLPAAVPVRTSPPAHVEAPGLGVWARGPGGPGPAVSVQVNVNGNGMNILGDAANEPSTSVDPIDPRRIVIGWRQFDNVASNFRQAGRASSRDGGRTWIPAPVLEPGVFRSDPCL